MLARLRSPWLLAAVLFAVAVVVRLCFIAATADADGPFSPYYKGDTPLWLAYAAAIDQGRAFDLELGLPFRPPGTAWLVALLWDGTSEGLRSARIGFALLGAVLAPLTMFVARPLGRGIAACAGGLVAVGAGPLLLSASPNSEVPYALLAVASLGLLSRAGPGAGGIGRLAGYGLLSGIACLFRAEHALFAVLGLAWLLWGWRDGAGPGGRAALGRVACVAAAAALPLLPWQLSGAQAIARFNRIESPPVSARTLQWSEPAVRALETVPGFARASTQRFVEATARHRGWGEVGEAPLRELVDDAFGSWPGALPTLPFVALYGPLNFRLANGPEADGGFSRAALDSTPPLRGGESRYPRDWLASLPRGGSLVMEYPPHAQLVVDGYWLGLAWILENPGDFAALAGHKLWITWAGVAHGLGGRILPLGASGIRNRVDIVAPDGGLATAWQIAWLGLALFGALRATRRREAWPWLWWIVAGLLTTVAFFGYARFGAMLAPAFGVLVGHALEPLFARRPAAWARGGLALLIAITAVEVLRWVAPPTILVDGAPAGVVEPFAPLEFEVRRVEAL